MVDRGANDERPGKTAEQHLLENVGIRVRRARVSKKMSRRALSEHCGVSQRYLAQLESGQGNVSIILLQRVARALDRGMEQLIGEDRAPDSEFATLMNSATPEQRARVMKILVPPPAQVVNARRIAFIGLRGAGKSTLGELAAEALQLPFVELNSEIEKVSGIPIHEVMALYGNEGYRKLEQQSLTRLIDERQEFVLAVAGGIVTAPESFRILLQNTYTIWLQASPQEHMARVRGQGDERPMAGFSDAMKELRDMLSSREEAYGKADLVIDTTAMNVDRCLREILQSIKKPKPQ